MHFKINTFKSDSLAIVFIAFFTGLVFYPVLNGTESFFINFDNVEQFYPWYQKLNYALHHNYLPLWDANTFGGRCFAGEFQTGIFYPVNIIWVYIFGTTESISTYSLDLLVIFHFFIAALGMYLVCRYWKIPHLASILGSIVFAFTGCVYSRAAGQSAIFFGLTLTPYSFLFILKYYATKKNSMLLYAGVFLGLQILAGHIQPFFHAAVICFSYLLYKIIVDKDDITLLAKAKILAKEYTVIMIAVVIVALPQLYTGGKYMSQAYRWVSADNPVSPGEKIPFSVYSERYSISPTELLNIIDRTDFAISEGNDLFIGLIPALLIAMLFLNYLKNDTLDDFTKSKKYFYWTMGLSVIIMLGQYTFVPLLLYVLPFVSNVRQLGRYSIVFHFIASLMVAVAFQYLCTALLTFNPRKNKRYIILASILIVNTVYILITQQNLFPKEILIHICALTICVLVILFIRNVSLVAFLLFICTISAIKVSSHYTTNSVALFSYPEKFFRKNKIVAYLEPKYGDCRVFIDTDSIAKNIGDVYKIQTKMGHGATMNKTYFDFIGQQWDINSEINDILNVKYILTKDTIPNLPLIMREEQLGINLYERPTAFPRVFLKSQAEHNSFSDTAIFSYKKEHYSDLYQKYEITSRISDTLIFSENYYKGWKICIDSKKVPVLQPTIKKYLPLQMGVVISPGKHIVELTYNPFY